MKQQQYEALESKCQEKEEQIGALDATVKTIQQDADKATEQYMSSVIQNEMNKEFMRFATLKELKGPIGKIVSRAYNAFKDWWNKNRKPEVAEKVRSSLMERLKEAKEVAHKQNEQHMPKLNDKSLKPER